MTEAIKYIFYAAGIVSVTFIVVFLACFSAWLFDKWRRDR